MSSTLQQVYSETSVDYSLIKHWVQRIKADESEPGQSDIKIKRRSGRTSIAVNPDNLARADEVIRADGRITIIMIHQSARITTINN